VFAVSVQPTAEAEQVWTADSPPPGAPYVEAPPSLDVPTSAYSVDPENGAERVASTSAP
jgi:hypothetical protein